MSFLSCLIMLFCLSVMDRIITTAEEICDILDSDRYQAINEVSVLSEMIDTNSSLVRKKSHNFNLFDFKCKYCICVQ